MAINMKITLSRLSHVIYQHPDLDVFKSFAKDFGFEQTDIQPEQEAVFLRGYGKDQYVYIACQAPAREEEKFIGGGFVAKTEDDFNQACQLPNAEVVDVGRWPGAGKMVKVRDPNGFEIRVLWNQEERTPPELGVSVVKGGRPTMNGALDKPRKGDFTRMIESPAMIHKLGHFGYETDNYEATWQWYNRHFNLKPSDILYLPGNTSNGNKEVDVATFFHLDLGPEYVDHHSFLLTRKQSPGTAVHHASFEVEDLDAQFMGHQWLLDRGHSLVWGIGRHVNGSQIFDYWHDPNEFIVEHYADGDLVNEDTEMVRVPAGKMAVWGPPAPVIWGGKENPKAVP